MPCNKVNRNENNFLEHYDRKLDSEENMLPESLEPCRTVLNFHGSELTITAKEPSLPEIDKPVLSMRESEVLQYLANGLSPDQIALKLNIKVRTVRKHLYHLEEKFKTGSRDQLMARAGYLKLCDPYKLLLK